MQLIYCNDYLIALFKSNNDNTTLNRALSKYKHLAVINIFLFCKKYSSTALMDNV